MDEILGDGSNGYLDDARCDAIYGWASSDGYPDAPDSVEVLADGVVIATVVADQFSQGLLDNGIGNGQHLWALSTPNGLKDGLAHEISARFAGTNIYLPTHTHEISQTLTCHGLRRDDYNSLDFWNRARTLTDVVNLELAGNETPAPGVNGNFCTRWTGQIEAKFSELTTFSIARISADNNFRFWVNGQIIVNTQTGRPFTLSGTVNLIAGQRYDLILEFINTFGAAQCVLKWSSASLPLEIVPQGQLYPPTTVPFHQCKRGAWNAATLQCELGNTAAGGSGLNGSLLLTF